MTTVRLWLVRRGRSVRRAQLAVLLVVVLGAGLITGLVLGTSGGGGQTRVVDPAASVSASAPGQAAAWVAGQVSHETTVVCDPAMCTLLRRHGFPASRLDALGTGGPGRSGAGGSGAGGSGGGLVVATAALRHALGGRLAALSAPVTLAGFGVGADRVTVQPWGSDALSYLTGLRADLATRRSVGAQLLLNRSVTAGPQARRQLSEGLADSRLIATIGMMAALHPVHLVSFGDAAPGASPGVPLRSAVLYGVTHGVTAGAALLASLRALLLAQHSPYRPADIATVGLGTGRSALRIVFAAPGPLGLLDASQPLVKIDSP